MQGFKQKEFVSDCMCSLFTEWSALRVCSCALSDTLSYVSLALVLMGHFQISAGLFSLTADCTGTEIECGSEEGVQIETSGSGWFRWTHGSCRLACPAVSCFSPEGNLI